MKNLYKTVKMKEYSFEGICRILPMKYSCHYISYTSIVKSHG